MSMNEPQQNQAFEPRPSHRDPVAILVDRLSARARLDAATLTSIRKLMWHSADLGTTRSTRAFDGLRDRVMVVLSGVLFHHAIVRSGARQVVAIYLPGEVVGLERTGNMVLSAHGPAQVAAFDAAAWRGAVDGHVAIRAAVEAELHTNLAIARAWLTNNCRREAATRVAHLLCEVAHRTGGTALPRLTQEFLSDCVGLTSVHTNRVLRRLETMECLRRDGDRYHISDAARLREFGEFDPGYLSAPIEVLETA